MIQRSACDLEKSVSCGYIFSEWPQTTANLVQTTSRADEHDVKRTIGSELHAPLEWHKLGVPLSQSVRKCGTAVRACLQRHNCVRKCFARTYHGCGLQSLVSEREREREGLFYFTPMWVQKKAQNNQHVVACVALRMCVGVQLGSVADCCALFGKWLLAIFSLSMSLGCRFTQMPARESEVYNNTWERT